MGNVIGLRGSHALMEVEWLLERLIGRELMLGAQRPMPNGLPFIREGLAKSA